MIRSITIIACLAILLFCTVVSFKWGIASAISYASVEKMSDWRKFYRHLDHEQWESIRYKLNEALIFNPYNPDLLQSLGAAYENEYAFYPTSDINAQSYRKVAQENYRDSLSNRPSWPHHWVDLALVKYRLNEIDSEFYQAMTNAIMLGPWEPWVQRIVADIGMHNWHNFQPEIQALIKTTVQNGVKHRDSAKPMLELVKRYDMFELVCTSGINDQLLKKYCEGSGYDGVDLQIEADIAPNRFN